jgi:hypothetical protein
MYKNQNSQIKIVSKVIIEEPFQITPEPSSITVTRRSKFKIRIMKLVNTNQPN